MNEKQIIIASDLTDQEKENLKKLLKRRKDLQGKTESRLPARNILSALFQGIIPPESVAKILGKLDDDGKQPDVKDRN